jgi:hypothetical protein
VTYGAHQEPEPASPRTTQLTLQQSAFALQLSPFGMHAPASELAHVPGMSGMGEGTQTSPARH